MRKDRRPVRASGTVPPPPALSVVPGIGRERSTMGRTILYGLFAASGFAGLIYESIWTHYLKLFLGHAAYAQSLVLIIFMGGLAIGSWLVARFSQRWRSPLLWYALAEGVIGVLALVFHKTFVSMSDAFYFALLP